MSEGGDAWALAAATLTTLIYALTAVRASATAGERLTILAGLAGGVSVLAIRSAITGTSLAGTLWAITTLNLLVLVVTAARPYRLFDLPGMKAKELRRLPLAQREERRRREQGTARAQAAFLGGVLALVVTYTALGWTFLD